MADGFQLPPDETMLDFWQNTAAMCDVSDLLEDTDRLSISLASATTAALEMCDPTCLRAGELYMSGMSVPTSRLAMQRLKLRGVLILGDAEAAPTIPEADGIALHIVQPPPGHLDLAASLQECAMFIQLHQPCLVCSDRSDGLSAIVCAAFIAASSPPSEQYVTDALKQVELRRGPLRLEMDDVEELNKFCATLPMALSTPPLGPRFAPLVPAISIGNNLKRGVEVAGFLDGAMGSDGAELPITPQMGNQRLSPTTPPAKLAAVKATTNTSVATKEKS